MLVKRKSQIVFLQPKYMNCGIFLVEQKPDILLNGQCSKVPMKSIVSESPAD